MKKYNKGLLEITIICFIIGFMLITQYRSVSQLGGFVSTTRAQELAGQLNELKKEKEGLINKISELEREIKEFEDQVVQDNQIVENLVLILRKLR